MAAQTLSGRILSFLGAAFAGSALLAAAPAQAETALPAATAASAAADVTEPLQPGASPLANGDENFRNLFAQWRALDGSTSNPAPRTTVSIPSRMPLGNARLSSGYGMRNHPVIGGRRNHKGVDLAAPTGTPIYATADGIVSKAERFSSYGLYISIEHGARLQTRFAHMSKLAVSAGERVRKGDVIGYVGSTGRSTGPHLHYEVRIDGRAVNPIPYMVESEAQQAFALAIGEGGRGGE